MLIALYDRAICYNKDMWNDTIVAISTPLATGAISIIRMSGEDALSYTRLISDLKADKQKANTIHYAHIYDGNEVIDEVLISTFIGPRSYTGEDMVEINCHGSVFNTRRILNLLLQKGCRLADPGEFTRRAFLSGRIDLSEAESVNSMIEANSLLQAKSAIRGVDGSIERLLNPLITDMSNILSMIEVNIDYPEYEDEKEMSQDVIKPEVEKWILKMKEMNKEAESFSLVKDGIRTAIVGKPNVGKSSLLNALLRKDKAIVTSIAGTTRDLVEDQVRIGELTLHLIDTAGIHESEDIVEKIGIDRSIQAVKEADLVLLVLDGSRGLEEEDYQLLELTKNSDRLIIWNKTDLNLIKQPFEGLHISAKENDVKELTDYLTKRYEPNVSLVDKDILNSERQISLMKEAKANLENLLINIEEMPIDLLNEDIRESYRCLCDILGKEYRENLIDHMFRNFCLGK